MACRKNTLEKLLAKRDIDYPTIPAARYGKAMEKASGEGSELFRNGGIPYRGDLTSKDCARAATWFHHHVRGAKTVPDLWVGLVPLKQEEILDQISGDPKYADMDRQNTILEIAESYECLSIFEERLFKNSFADGRAGNQQ
ncbi:hypothetical protein B0H14DRAFT_2564730 [Mycena olivaceomarginata]|jgi:hypothetical protein|nr:hypothetical protein B0H14DRAFT_2564730 [Mycena olivaceomarginata]